MSNPAERIICIEPTQDSILPTDSVAYTTSMGPLLQGVQKLADTRVSYAISTSESRNGATQYYGELSALNCDIIKKNANSIIKISGIITGEIQTPWDHVFVCTRYDSAGVFNGEVGTPDALLVTDGQLIGFAIAGLYNDNDNNSTAQSISFTLVDTAATVAGKWTYRIRMYGYSNSDTYVLNGTFGDQAQAAYERYTSQILVEEYQSAEYVGMPRIVTFENDGTWNIPDGVTSLSIYAYGGGGGGGGGAYTYRDQSTAQYTGSGGGGGGSGAQVSTTINVSSVVNPNRILTITIGTGGAGGQGGGIGGNTQTSGSNGGTTTVTNPTLGTIVSCAGGVGGVRGLIDSVGGNGGSGYYGGGGGGGNGGGSGGAGTSANGTAGAYLGNGGNGGGQGGWGGYGVSQQLGIQSSIYGCNTYETFYRCGGGGGGGPGGGIGGGWNYGTGSFYFTNTPYQCVNGTGITGAGGGGGTGGNYVQPFDQNGQIVANNPCGGTSVYAASGGGVGAKGSVTIVYSFGLTGSNLFDTPGTYQWLCPPGVTSVSVLCIGGGGGGGGAYWAGGGGGGGGLGYANNINVKPGKYYTVVVGSGGAGTTGGVGATGGTSSFTATRTCSATGGSGGGGIAGTGTPTGPYSGGAGGTYTGDGGGNGGTGGTSLNDVAGGGGGAGGYSGNGGNGGTNGSGTNGSGGGGGGAGSGGSNSSNGSAPSGGGVGIYGQGANGTGGGSGNPGTGGSGGTTGSGNYTVGGSANKGGTYGGGGGGQSNDSVNTPGCNGGAGVVRIVYPGTTRQFPSTNVT